MENNQIPTNESLNNIQSNNAPVDSKIKIFRRSAFAWPIIGIILAIFYLTDLSLYVFWHPIFTVLFKIIYFPFFVLPEESTNDLFFIGVSGGMAAFPNLLTIGIAIIISLGWLYILNRVVIYWVEKYTFKRVILISNILIMIIFLIFSFILTNYQVNKCVSKRGEKISNYNGIIDINLETWNDFKKYPTEKLKLFNFLNSINEPIYDFIDATGWLDSTLVKTEKGKEVEIACKLNLYPNVSAYPVSLDEYINNSDWGKIRDAVCRANGFKSEATKECVEFMLINSKKMKDVDYKISEDGKVNMYKNINIKNNYPNDYSDDFISFDLNGSKFKFLDLGKTGLSFEDVELGNYIQMYRINKFFGYEIIGSLNTLEPYMNIHIPNVSDYPFDGIYDEMDLMSGQIASETKIKLGGYDYLMKNFTESGVEKVVYYTQVNGRKIRIALGMSQYFVKYPELQKEFEDIISTINYNF